MFREYTLHMSITTVKWKISQIVLEYGEKYEALILQLMVYLFT